MTFAKSLAVGCPTCGVAKGQSCRARGSRRVTDTHAARTALHYETVRLHRAEELK